MTVPFFGLVQNFLLVIPVVPVKASFKISPDQYPLGEMANLNDLKHDLTLS